MAIADGTGPYFPIIDQVAAKEAAKLIIEASERLNLLGPQPIYIASHRDKFNDAGYDDYWRAVRLGHSHWEASYFFEGTDRYGEEKDPKYTGIEERTWTRGDPFGENGLAEGALARSTMITSARRILNEMESEDWQLVLKVAIGEAPFDWLGQGIYIDRDVPFLIIGNYDGAGFRDFYLATDGELIHAASDRHCFLGTKVDYFDLDDELLPSLPARARNYLQPTVRDEAAHTQLSQLILNAQLNAKRLNLKRVQYLTEASVWHGIRELKLSLPSTEMKMTHFYSLRDGQADGCGELVDSFDRLKKENWLKLLSQTYDINIFDRDQFAITITAQKTTLTRFEAGKRKGLLRNATVFSLVDGKLGDGVAVGTIASGVATL